MIQVTPVVLCGGSGTRLWPLSRTGFPKQFLCLTGDESLFQHTARRLVGLANNDIALNKLLIVSNEDHRFLASEQLREIGVDLGMALLEPVGKNTAPALTLAALAAVAQGEDPILVATPADQTIADVSAYTDAIQAAVYEACNDHVVILGVKPDSPETGYGYIKADDKHSAKGAYTLHALPVDCFVEKPDAATAQHYVDAGHYYWNAGIFVLKASIWLAALELFRPDILAATKKSWAQQTQDVSSGASCFIRPDKEQFKSIPSESIDYAVMEPLAALSTAPYALKMVPLQAGWSDLGAWDAVWDVLPKDTNGNAHFGDVLSTNSHNTLVHATDRLVSLVGVDNLVVIETPDVVMVADKSCSQDVKHMVSALQNQRREEHALHRKVHRPWGWYDSIDESERFKVKRIQVKPGASLSLQMHHHRAEHWIVVKGTAEVTCGDKIVLLTENQSTYIPLGETHRLRNPGTIPLEIIEVQSGSYLGEDDIVRLEDTYGRK